MARELVQVLKDCAVQKAREGGLSRAKVYGHIDANNGSSVHLVDDMGFELEQMESVYPVSYTHLTLPTNREV